MKINHTIRFAAACLALLLLGTSVACGQTPPAPDQETAAPIGTSPSTSAPATQLAPDFSVLDTAGNSVNLSDLVGKPVVLNFWASWCPPCKAEMPDFEEMYKQYGDRVHFMVVNLTDGTRETVDSAKAYVGAQGYTFPVYFDTTMQAANAYRVYSIPTTYFINADGTLLSYAEGMIDARTLETQLKRLLGE